ncbi:MAG: hypothetical protein KDB22_03805 [Planctomycetales bacterium]|nr:hypothetical protein [Planctomycetales bacterium]
MKYGALVIALIGVVAGPSVDAQETGPGNGPAVAPAPKVYPLDVVVNTKGEAFVADRQLHGVWQFSDQKLSILYEGSPKYRTPLYAAFSIALDQEGRILVGDPATREVYRMEQGKPVPITGGKIGIPVDLAVKSDGTIYVADLEQRRLLRIPAGSGEVEPVADVNPRGVFVDSKDQVWVVSQDPQQLQIVADDGSSDVIVDHRVFNFPHQVVVNAAGEAFVTDGYEKAIWKVVRGSEPTLWCQGAPLDNPVGIAIYNDLPVVVDPRASQVFKFDGQGKPEGWFTISR